MSDPSLSDRVSEVHSKALKFQSQYNTFHVELHHYIKMAGRERQAVRVAEAGHELLRATTSLVTDFRNQEQKQPAQDPKAVIDTSDVSSEEDQDDLTWMLESPDEAEFIRRVSAGEHFSERHVLHFLRGLVTSTAVDVSRYPESGISVEVQELARGLIKCRKDKVKKVLGLASRSATSFVKELLYNIETARSAPIEDADDEISQLVRKWIDSKQAKQDAQPQEPTKEVPGFPPSDKQGKQDAQPQEPTEEVPGFPPSEKQGKQDAQPQGLTKQVPGFPPYEKHASSQRLGGPSQSTKPIVWISIPDDNRSDDRTGEKPVTERSPKPSNKSSEIHSNATSDNEGQTDASRQSRRARRIIMSSSSEESAPTQLATTGEISAGSAPQKRPIDTENEAAHEDEATERPAKRLKLNPPRPAPGQPQQSKNELSKDAGESRLPGSKLRKTHTLSASEIDENDALQSSATSDFMSTNLLSKDTPASSSQSIHSSLGDSIIGSSKQLNTDGGSNKSFPGSNIGKAQVETTAEMNDSSGHNPKTNPTHSQPPGAYERTLTLRRYAYDDAKIGATPTYRVNVHLGSHCLTLRQFDKIKISDRLYQTPSAYKKFNISPKIFSQRDGVIIALHCIAYSAIIGFNREGALSIRLDLKEPTTGSTALISFNKEVALNATLEWLREKRKGGAGKGG